MEWHENVGGKAYINVMLNHVLLDIKRKMHWMQRQPLFIQQDGAKPHIPALNNEDLLAALKSDSITQKSIFQYK